MLTFNHHVCVQLECLGFRWILINFDKKCCVKSDNLKINHDLQGTLLHTKQNTKIDVFPSSPFIKVSDLVSIVIGFPANIDVAYSRCLVSRDQKAY